MRTVTASRADGRCDQRTFIPQEYTLTPGQRRRPEPLYAWYGMSVTCGVGVVLGTAAEALGKAREVLEGKTSKATMRSVTEESFILAGVARAAAVSGAGTGDECDEIGDLMAAPNLVTGQRRSDGVLVASR